MQYTVDSVTSQEDLHQVCRLLQSAKHVLMAQLLQGYKPSSSQRYALELRVSKLCLIETSLEIDPKTAATSALIYACWLSNYELVRLIVQDLYELIDVSMTVGGMNALEWAIEPVKLVWYYASTVLKARLADALDICRYLIIQYGKEVLSRIDALLNVCLNNECTDIVAYIVVKHGLEQSCQRTSNVFEFLVRAKQDIEAEFYLRLRLLKDERCLKHLHQGYHRCLVSNIFEDVLYPTARHGSVYMFKLVLGMFESSLGSDRVRGLMLDLCESHMYSRVEYVHDKVELVLDRWAKVLTTETIMACLADQWDLSYRARRDKLADMGEDHGRTAQLIVDRRRDPVECVTTLSVSSALDPIECVTTLSVSSALRSQSSLISSDRLDGVSLALAVCCWPSNLELFDAIFDSNLELIDKDPLLFLQHALLECCSLGDIDMFVHILGRCNTQTRSIVVALALEFWCCAGDLEAVEMLLVSESDCVQLSPYVEKALVQAGIRGDAELVDLIMRTYRHPINESRYQRAFRGACYNGHEDTIRVLADHSSCIDLRSDSDYDLTLKNVRVSIIDLLNSLFGTDIDPSRGSTRQLTNMPFKGFPIEYTNRPIVYYKLDRV